MQYFLSNLVKASGYINDDFKEVIELAVEWPIGGDEAIEIG